MQEMVRTSCSQWTTRSASSTGWMKRPRKALEKRATFSPKLGYPDSSRIQGRGISRDSAWDNVVAASRWNVADNRGL